MGIGMKWRLAGWKWLQGAAIGCAGLLLLGGPATSGRAATLSSLLAGGVLDVANSRFSQWQVVQIDTTSTAVDFAQIQVNPLATNPAAPAIQILPGTQLRATGINAIDLVLRFRVDALAGTNTFTSQTLELTSLAFGGTGEIVYVSSEMSDGVAADLGSTVVYSDNVSDVLQLVDTENFAAKSQVVVTTNVFVTGTNSGDQATIGGFIQRLSQNGAPGQAGDFNQNGVVDAADYTVWRNKVGAAAGTLPNDTAGGVIGAAQYSLWKSNFGLVGSAALSGLGSTAVPEAATGWLLAVLVAAAGRGFLRQTVRHDAI